MKRVVRIKRTVVLVGDKGKNSLGVENDSEDSVDDSANLESQLCFRCRGALEILE